MLICTLLVVCRLEFLIVGCVELYQFLRFELLHFDSHEQTSCGKRNWYNSTHPTINNSYLQTTVLVIALHTIIRRSYKNVNSGIKTID